MTERWDRARRVSARIIRSAVAAGGALGLATVASSPDPAGWILVAALFTLMVIVIVIGLHMANGHAFALASRRVRRQSILAFAATMTNFVVVGPLPDLYEVLLAVIITAAAGNATCALVIRLGANGA